MKIKYLYGYYPEKEFTLIKGEQKWDPLLASSYYILTVEEEVDGVYKSDLGPNKLYATEFIFDEDKKLISAFLPENF
jgi:hypothetical protein